MGLLNRLFGSKRSLGREIVLDSQRISELWDTYLSTYPKKLDLVKSDSTVFASTIFGGPEPKWRGMLQQLEELISTELVNIGKEQRTMDELLKDMNTLAYDIHEKGEIHDMHRIISEETDIDVAVRRMLKKLCRILQTELEVISTIGEDREKLRSAWIGLKELITGREREIVYSLTPKTHDESRREKLNNAVSAVLNAGRIEVQKPRWEYELQAGSEHYLLRADMEKYARRVWVLGVGKNRYYVLRVLKEGSEPLAWNQIKTVEAFRDGKIEYMNVSCPPWLFSPNSAALFYTDRIEKVTAV